MKIQLLPSTIENGIVVNRQHLACFVLDGKIAIDAGSLSVAGSEEIRSKVRDVVLTHAHLDHIAGLPLFIDDLFPSLSSPVRVHATAEVLDVLREHVFNWKVFPDFSEIQNEFGPVLEYREVEVFREFAVGEFQFTAIPVNHKVPSYGYLVRKEGVAFAISGDTAETDDFWTHLNGVSNLRAVLIECAFPDEMSHLAEVSHHLTPKRLNDELAKLLNEDCSIYIVNIKPFYRETTIGEIRRLRIPNLRIFDSGETIEV
ncbi:MAG: 3',5'-cyclic-nucleotide phosphodiesterase [Pyrinomonadaceae bacterium]